MAEQSSTLREIAATADDLVAKLDRLAGIVAELERRKHATGRFSLVEARALVQLDKLRGNLEKQVLTPLADLMSSK